MRQRRPAWVIAASAALGALIGAVNPQPVYSVELAQVMAGQVVLPATSPMAIHHGKVFSLFVDGAAVLLWSGVSVEGACRLLTIVMGALAFGAVSLLGYAFTRNVLVTGVLPLALFGYSVGGDAHGYPFGLPLTNGDLGANGMTAAVATLSLIALGSRTGLVALGLLPGLHATWAVGAWVIAGAGAVFDRALRLRIRRDWRWLAGGLGCVAAAWLLHVALTPHFPVGPEVDSELVNGFQRNWDPHHRPINVSMRVFVSMFAADGVFIVLAAGALRGGYPRRRRIRFWLAGGLILAVPALMSALVVQRWPGSMPSLLSALMMSRWLNLNTLALPALLAGLALYPVTARSRRRSAVTGVTTLLAVAGCAPFFTLWLSRDFTIEPHVFPPEDAAVLQAARSRPGTLLAISPLSFPQLMTGRPQLLDLQLVDVLIYAPRAAVRVEQILSDVYGLSLLRPPGTDDELSRGLEQRFASRTPEEWQALASRYDLTDVLVPAQWRPLTLTVVATSPDMTLYSIP